MTDTQSKVVLDTNVLISAALSKKSIPLLALWNAFLFHEVLISEAYCVECHEVFQRAKFDRYSSVVSRLEFLEEVLQSSTSILIQESVTDCVDPKDNMILELALSGAARFIVTGDDHLLRLHPWRGVRIVTPAVFLEL